MAEVPSSRATPGRFPRFVAGLMRYGVPGTLLAVLLMRAVALAPVALVHLKSAKGFSLALVCCVEVGWLFGGAVGLMVAAQWLVHELAHVRAAERLGLRPGWRGLVPFVGVYLGTTPGAFGSRENEALVAAAGVVAGLVAATALLAAGTAFDSRAATLAAKIGFGLTLVHLLPFRPFDGGRIFPGCLWRYRDDVDDAERGDAASRRFLDGCRRLLARALRRPDYARGPRVMLVDALHLLFYAAGLALTLIYLLLPPLVFALALLAGFAAFWVFFGAMLALDPKAIAAPAPHELRPRYPAAAPERAGRDLPWRDRAAALAALGLHLAAVIAAMVGVAA